MQQCTGRTRSGKRCSKAAVEGTKRCILHPVKHRRKAEPKDEGEVFGANAPPPEEHDFTGWSRSEIAVFVRNETGGRVELNQNLPLEAVVENAQEALA